MGWLINRGGLPYLDAVDHKPPVAFYINAFALHFVPRTSEGLHWFALFYNFLTLICVAWVAKILFQSLNGALWVAFAYAVFSASPAIHGFTASTEIYALLPTVLSLLLAVAGKRNGSRTLLIASGIFGAMACWTKQTAFTSVLFVFLTLCTGLEAPALWLGGAVSFSVALAAYFYAKGIFQPFIYWCFIYELAYTRVPFSDTLGAMRDRFGEIARGDLILPVAGFGVAVWGAIRKRSVGLFLTGFLILSLAGTVPGYSYAHYFVQLAPAVALAGGYALWVLQRTKFVLAAACGALVLGVSLGANRQYFFASDPDAVSHSYFGSNPFPESKAVGAFLAASTSPDDRVLIVGSEPQIFFYAGRQSVSPFVIIYPLTSVHKRYQEFEARMWEDVRKAPPEYVVVSRDIPTSINWDGNADLEIVRNICGLLAQRYAIERLAPVAAAQDWPDETGTCLAADKPALYVYKRTR